MPIRDKKDSIFRSHHSADPEDILRVLIIISLHFMQKSISKHQLLKSQIPSTKLQMVRQAHHPELSRRVNLKLQYSMTKPVGTFFLQGHIRVWNFEFLSL